MNILVVNIKKYFFTIFFALFTISLLFFSESNFIAAQNGLALFLTNVFPSLFPFFVATELILKSNLVPILARFLNKIMKPLFNISGNGSIAVILGIISGYPIGAKVVCNLKKDKKISNLEAERLISFTNNSGPLFILGTVGISIFGNKKIGIILLLSHIFSSIIVGIIFRFWKINIPDFSNYSLSYPYKEKEENNLIKISTIGEILGDSIKKSIFSLLNIGGFIIFFSVIISIIQNCQIIENFSNLFSFLGINSNILNSVLYGFIELTNGVHLISQEFLKFPKLTVLFTSFILGFGGISVLFQVYSIISKENISIKPYFYGKLLQGIISFFITLTLL